MNEAEKQLKREHWITDNLPEEMDLYEHYGAYPTIETFFDSDNQEEIAKEVLSLVRENGFSEEQVEVNGYTPEQGHTVELVLDLYAFENEEDVKKLLNLVHPVLKKHLN